MREDREHLHVLSICFYVFGALIGLAGCIPFIHLSMGIAIVSGSFNTGRGQGPPAAFGWFFIGIACAIITLFWSLAACAVCTGRFLSQRRHYIFCLVVACVCCLQMPLGTVLGVFTIIVLQRPTVKELFEAEKTLDALPASERDMREAF